MCYLAEVHSPSGSSAADSDLCAELGDWLLIDEQRAARSVQLTADQGVTTPAGEGLVSLIHVLQTLLSFLCWTCFF